MIIFLFTWLSFDVSLSLESTFIKWQSQVKNTSLFRKFYRPEYILTDAVFIDVSSSKVIAFDSLNLKNVIITNRRILDTLFTLLGSQVDYKFILCDLIFDIPGDYDSILNATTTKLKKIGFPTGSAVASNNSFPLTNLPGGSVGYSYIGNFYKLADEMVKFRLVADDGSKSLPLFMAESIKQMKLTKNGALLQFDNKRKRYLNNITIDDHINNPNLMRTENISAAYTPEDIIHLLRYRNTATRSLLKDKIIVIGDLENDIHKTPFGDMPGSLILYNIFLSLANGENTVTFGWVAFLFIMFTLLSYFIFYGQQSRPQKVIDFIQEKIIQKFFLGGVLSQVVINIFFLFIISIFSHFIFRKNIELIPLSIWLTVLEYIIGRIKAKDAWFKNKPYNAKDILNFIFLTGKPNSI